MTTLSTLPDTFRAPRQHSPAAPWWVDAVVYQVYLRSFADSNGDGDGDLAGLTSRLDHLCWLGVDALWLTPHYPSPQADGGYDVTNYCDVDPMYGTTEDFGDLLEAAHARGLRVLIDLVPNHTSSQHPWFKAAMADADSVERDYYHFADPGPDGGVPNNWQSCFGGPAWTLDPVSGQYYLHLFSPDQPDLNWRHPHVRSHFEDVLRFWLDLGVDGVRVDVAAGLVKDAQLRDNPGVYAADLMGHGPEQRHTWDQPEVHDIWAAWRAIANEYAVQRALIGEVCLADLEAVSQYCRTEEMHSAFALQLLKTPWEATAWARCLGKTAAAFDTVAGVPSWVLGNHDKDRATTRFGGGDLGHARARGAAMLLLSLPGSAYVYAGDELGLPNADVDPKDRRDPIFVRSGGERVGRDGCRTPMPWEESGPTLGFSSAARGWLPTPAGWQDKSVQAQRKDPSSTLSLHRSALHLRRELEAGTGRAVVSSHPDRPDVLEVGNVLVSGQRLTALLNMGEAPVLVPDVGGHLLLASAADVVRSSSGVTLPVGACAWVFDEQ